jgi:Tol biopolymer transport system component
MMAFDLLPRRIATAVVLVIAATAASSIVEPASATFPGRNGKMVLSQYGDLYVATPAGGRHQLTSGPADDETPTFSADGRRILFSRDPVDAPRRLYTMRADGTGAKPLPGSGPYDIAPALAPGGRKLVFQSSRHLGPDEIWTIRSDGTRAHALTSLGGWNGRPSFSPDGRTIVFARGDDGVWAMDSDGGHIRRLATTDTEDAPSFSPNGRRIAFEKNSSVYTMRADGSDRRRLTHEYIDHQPTYSPDGKRIVFFRFLFHETGVEALGTFTIGTDGKHLRKIDDGVGDRLDWQPLPR